MRALLFGILFPFLGLACSQEESIDAVYSLPYFNEASFTPHWISSDSDSLTDFHKIPSFSLTNQEGEEVNEYTFEDKIFVADFFFATCPGICKKMVSNMTILQDEFIDDDEVLLLSHSVTPEADSVAVLKQYAEIRNIESEKWHLVTGDREQIYRLGRLSYFVEEDLGEKKRNDDFLHTENFILVDKNRHIRGIYSGLNKASIAQLVEDIRSLKMRG